MLPVSPSGGVVRLFATLATLTLALSACEAEPVGPEGGVAGFWEVQANEDARNCNEGTSSRKLTIRIDQTGNTLNVRVDGKDYRGTLDGTTATWSGSYPEDGGTTSDSWVVHFQNGNTRFTAESQWTWRGNNGNSCVGTVTATGTKK